MKLWFYLTLTVIIRNLECISGIHAYIKKFVNLGKSRWCFFASLCRGAGWDSVAPDCASELQARVAEGEFWLDEAEFMSQFDDVTVGYPISEEGYLKSIYTGIALFC